MATAELIFDAPLPAGVQVALAQYEKDTNNWIRDVRVGELPAGLTHVLVPLQVRMDADHKYRVNVNNPGAALKVQAAYLIVYK
jgi:hypothetical protein